MCTALPCSACVPVCWHRSLLPSSSSRYVKEDTSFRIRVPTPTRPQMHAHLARAGLSAVNHPMPRPRHLASARPPQALAQYLVNLNVWTHNLLVLSSRRSKRPSNSGELWDEVRCQFTGQGWGKAAFGR